MTRRGSTEHLAFTPTSHLRPIAKVRREHAHRASHPSDGALRAAPVAEGVPVAGAVDAAPPLRPERLYMVAHDLRVPLSAILLQASSLALRERSGDARFRTGLEAIARSARRMERLVRDLLDLGRLVQGKFSVQPTRESLRAVLQEALESARLIGGARTVDVQIHAGDVDVQVDRDRVLQVFANLVANAVRFTPERGRITLGTTGAELAREFVTCWVDDDGVGLHPEHATQAFDPFWQARRGDGGGREALLALNALGAFGFGIDVRHVPSGLVDSGQ